jgi:hypothetical protein
MGSIFGLTTSGSGGSGSGEGGVGAGNCTISTVRISGFLSTSKSKLGMTTANKTCKSIEQTTAQMMVLSCESDKLTAMFKTTKGL